MPVVQISGDPEDLLAFFYGRLRFSPPTVSAEESAGNAQAPARNPRTGGRSRFRSRSPCHTTFECEGLANNGCMQKQRFVNSEPQSTRSTRQEGQNPKEGEHFLQEWQAFVGKNLRFEAKSGGGAAMGL